MTEEIDNHIQEAKSSMDKSLGHLGDELNKLRSGKASPAMLNGIFIEYYGSMMELAQVANVTTPDAKTIAITPWEKKMLSAIEQAIFSANIGLTPQNNGELIRLIIPPLTEERRKDLAKKAKHLGEDAKVSIRNTRHKVIDYIKRAVKEGVPEDAGKRKEDDTQKLTDSYIHRVEEIIQAKEKEIMTI